MSKRKETPAQRSAIMARVKAKDTVPEMRVRRLVFSLGYRYRLHDSRLPGKPDLVFPSRRKAMFIHGCFWHGHDCRAGQNKPTSNLSYWDKKLARNSERDQRNQFLLKESGWDFLILWECEIKDRDRLEKVIRNFLGG